MKDVLWRVSLVRLTDAVIIYLLRVPSHHIRGQLHHLEGTRLGDIESGGVSLDYIHYVVQTDNTRLV